MLAITCSENVYARPCIFSYERLDRYNNTKIANSSADDGTSIWAQFSGSSGRNAWLLTELKMIHLNNPFQNCTQFRNLLKRYREIIAKQLSHMAQNEHVYAICCWLEVDDYVISGEDIDNCLDYVSGNVWVRSGAPRFTSFQENRN